MPILHESWDDVFFFLSLFTQHLAWNQDTVDANA